MGDPIRFGYVGFGKMAQCVHLPNFAALPGCRLEAVAEARPKLRAELAAKFGVPRRYASHLELCADKNLDAVGVSAPYAAQGEIACDLLRAGKSVFMEKPMAVSVAQAERILAAERAGGGRLMVAYMKRYDAGNELAKRHLDEFRRTGELGPLTYVRAHGFCGQDWMAGNSVQEIASSEPIPPGPAQPCLPDWLPEKHRGGYLNYLQQYTHNLNLVRWFTGAGEIGVRAVDFNPENGYHGVAVLEAGGTRAVLESGASSHWGWDEHTQLYFRDGWVRVESPPLLLKNVTASVEVYRAGARQELTRPLPADSRERWSWSYQREAAHFIACLASGEPFRSSGQDTLHDVRGFETIYRKYLGLA